ncbi:MAG: hypothetical protein QOE90_1534 [Thermoplasmata archaeon]|jgi:hypothetical protein|nr:hypothetical protein [Thermoplasmata archaeon]
MNAKNFFPTLAVALCLGAPLLLTALAGPASADDASVTENVTAMKDNIVNTLATWVPFVILFIMLGLALSAIGIRLFGNQQH